MACHAGWAVEPVTKRPPVTPSALVSLLVPSALSVVLCASARAASGVGSCWAGLVRAIVRGVLLTGEPPTVSR